MTRYIAAYDTESPACLAATRALVALHRRHQMPATFFIVGQTLAAHPREYRELLDDPLFEIASHTWSHKMLRDHPICGPAASDAEIAEEIQRSKQIVEEVFERPCVGLRPGCSFDNALRGAALPLRLVHEAGYRYVSSLAWGPKYSLPALLTEPFTYADDGYPGLWELPGHGWHDNVLANLNPDMPYRILLWPPAMPEAIPTRVPRTAEEMFAVNRVFLERAQERGLPFVSLIWHPWSLHGFDPELRAVDLLFTHVRQRGMPATTYAAFLQGLPCA